MNASRKAGGVVVHSSSNKICIISNEFNLLVLPKGGIKPTEEELDAAKREVLEETGIDSLKLIRDLGMLERRGHSSALSDNIDTLKRIHFYLFTTDQTELQPIVNDSLSASWVATSELETSLSYPEEVQFIKDNCPELFAR